MRNFAQQAYWQFHCSIQIFTFLMIIILLIEMLCRHIRNERLNCTNIDETHREDQLKKKINTQIDEFHILFESNYKIYSI